MDYQGFRQQYEERHPASVPVLNEGMDRYPSWLKYVAFVVFVAVSVVSGAHTISTMRQSLIESMGISEGLKDPVALAAFVGFEGFLFISVFAWQRDSHRWIAYGSTGIVYFVIVLANINDVLRSMGTGDWLNIAFILGVGIGVPTVALASGKMFVDIYQSKRMLTSAAQDAHREACIAWDNEIEKAWEKHLKLSGKSTVQPVHVPSISRPLDTDARRNIDAPATVRKHLEDNPQDIHLSVRELGDKLGVSKSTTHNVLKEFRAVQSNGHLESALNGHSNNGNGKV